MDYELSVSQIKSVKGRKKEVKKKAELKKIVEVIEVNLVAFEVCYFSKFVVFDILQRLMFIFLSHVSSV